MAKDADLNADTVPADRLGTITAISFRSRGEKASISVAVMAVTATGVFMMSVSERVGWRSP